MRANKHHIMFTDRSDGVYREGFFEFDEFFVVICGGCETRSFIKKSIRRRPDGNDSGEEVLSFDMFPPRVLRKIPNWLEKLPNEVCKIYEEINRAHQCGFFRLCTMGARSLIERVMIDKVGDNGSFKKNLDAMVNNKHISESQKEFLDSMIEMGHAVMHRGYSPDENAASTLLDLSDAIVFITYVAKERGDALKLSTPPRN
ncbi:DUF4145 domain-containing protein [Azospirillum doebereinerae]|nr:DUF4145 domain-containing protein [Azospirillum doebereinerae]